MVERRRADHGLASPETRATVALSNSVNAQQMSTLLSRVTTGLRSGVTERHKGFLTLLAICLAMVPAMLLGTSMVIHEPLSLEFIMGIGPSLWISLAFSAYLAVVACLQQYHRSRGETREFGLLAIQVDVVVSAGLFALILTSIAGS